MFEAVLPPKLVIKNQRYAFDPTSNANRVLLELSSRIYYNVRKTSGAKADTPHEDYMTKDLIPAARKIIDFQNTNKNTRAKKMEVLRGILHWINTDSTGMAFARGNKLT